MILGLTLLRIAVPFVVFKVSFLGIFLTVLLDILDWELFSRMVGDYMLYQRWDKILDAFSSIVFGWYLLGRWRNHALEKVVLFFLIWRLLGVILFEATSYSYMLVLFPNLFDNLFYLYEFIRIIFPEFVTNSGIPVKTIAGLMAFKFIQEYTIHISGVFPWQLPYGRLFGDALYLNIIFWCGLFLVLHGFWIWASRKREKDLENFGFRI